MLSAIIADHEDYNNAANQYQVDDFINIANLEKKADRAIQGVRDLRQGRLKTGLRAKIEEIAAEIVEQKIAEALANFYPPVPVTEKPQSETTTQKAPPTEPPSDTYGANNQWIKCTKYNPCPQNSFCFDDYTAGPQCSCFIGYTGAYCQYCASGYHTANGECTKNTYGAYNQFNKCTYSNPCLQGGMCVDDDDLGPQCICPVGHTGTVCQDCATGYHTINGQPPSYSNNGCMSDLYGSYNQFIRCTKTNPCLQGGVCADDYYNGPQCTCISPYEGAVCELCADGFATVNGLPANGSNPCIAISTTTEVNSGEDGSGENGSGEVGSGENLPWYKDTPYVWLGEFTTPSFPYNYPSSQFKSATFELASARNIFIEFEAFDLEDKSTSGCFDYLQFDAHTNWDLAQEVTVVSYTGQTVPYFLTQRVCGEYDVRVQPYGIPLIGSYNPGFTLQGAKGVDIFFRSDSSVSRGGVKINVYAYPGDAQWVG